MYKKFTKRKKPKVMFVNCGHKQIRRLEDCARLKFVSAGHGKVDGAKPFYFSNQIRNLIIGDIIAVYRNRVGYVGIARVISEPMDICDAYLLGRKVDKEMFSPLSNMFDLADDPGYAECLVQVEWLTAVHLSDVEGSGACYGIFAKPLVVCSLDNQVELKQRLETHFGITFQRLLNAIR